MIKCIIKEHNLLAFSMSKSKAKLFRWGLRKGRILSMAHAYKKYPEDNVIKFWKN